MPSPFPGMDPYLEHPEFFPDLHNALIGELRRALQARLPAPYFAMSGSRVWVEFVERPLEPDVNVLRSGPPPQPPVDSGTATAVAVNVHPVIVLVPQDETREQFVEIHTVHGERRLVTAIEVLSPSNKATGAQGRDLYLRKQRELLGSEVHLVEIDLLRGGAYTTAVPHDRAVQEAGAFDYHVCVHRFDEAERFYVYPILLRQRLPEIAVPLSPGDPPVVVDLQAVFDGCYDDGPYRRVSPYAGRTPEPPLPPDQAEWAVQLLRERGLTPPT